MTAELTPLPEPEQPADAIFYIEGQDLFTADQMRAFRAEGERLARLQSLEDAALAVDEIRGDGGESTVALFDASEAIRQLKDRK